MKLLLGPHTGIEDEYIVYKLSDKVRVWAREQTCLKALSEDREWRCSCDVSRQVVPYRGAGSCECATADCRSTNDRYVQAIRAGRAQSTNSETQKSHSTNAKF